MILPFHTSDLPGFKTFVNINPFCQTHNGFDFGAFRTTENDLVLGLPPGIPIRPVGPGHIKEVYADWATSPYHLFVTVDHGDGIEADYVHIDPNTTLKPGMPVSMETVLGHLTGGSYPVKSLVGSPMAAWYTHLHLGARKDGVAVDPCTLVPFDRRPLELTTETNLLFLGFDLIDTLYSAAKPFLDAGLLEFSGKSGLYRIKKR